MLRTLTQQIRALWKPAARSKAGVSNASNPPVSVAMFHPGRCGSTVLAKMLNRHTRVCWAGELFEDMPERYKELLPDPNIARRVLDDWALRCTERNKDIFGFETKYLPQQHFRQGFLDTTLEEYLSLLRSMRRWRFVVLRRDNYLRRAISAQVGAQTRQWHARQKGDAPTRITLDITGFKTGDRSGALLDLFGDLDENYAKVTTLLADADVLQLSYEEDIEADPMKAYGKICDFLHITSETPRIDLVKTNPYPLEAMLDNWVEVQSLLKGTRYEWMLSA